MAAGSALPRGIKQHPINNSVLMGGRKMVTPAAGRGTALRLPGVPAPGGGPSSPAPHKYGARRGCPRARPPATHGGSGGGRGSAQPQLWIPLENPGAALESPRLPARTAALPNPDPASLSPSPVPCPQPTAGDGDTPPSLATTSLSPVSAKDPHPTHHLAVPKPRPTSPALTQGPPSSSPQLPAGATKPPVTASRPSQAPAPQSHPPHPMPQLSPCAPPRSR